MVDVMVDGVRREFEVVFINVLRNPIEKGGVRGHPCEGRDVVHCEVEAATVVFSHQS